MSNPSGHLLNRLDIFVNLVADRHALALDRDGRLEGAETQLLADALDLSDAFAPASRGLAAVELLRGLAEAIGLVRDRGERLEATTLRHPWAQLDPDLRAGLVFAAWCHRMPWDKLLGDDPDGAVRALRDGRTTVLHLLLDLPTGTDVPVADMAATVARRIGLPSDDWLARALAAVFLDPLVALGVADVAPPPPDAPRTARLRPQTRHAIGAALIAAGEDVPSPAPPTEP